MYVVVDLEHTPPTVELREGEDGTRLHVEVRRGGADDEASAGADRALRASGFGRVEGEDALLGLARLRHATGTGRDDG